MRGSKFCVLIAQQSAILDSKAVADLNDLVHIEMCGRRLLGESGEGGDDDFVMEWTGVLLMMLTILVPTTR